MSKKVIYQVIFDSCGYQCVDFETEDYNQAQEVRIELTAQMRIMGERDFCYIIREKRSEI